MSARKGEQRGGVDQNEDAFFFFFLLLLPLLRLQQDVGGRGGGGKCGGVRGGEGEGKQARSRSKVSSWKRLFLRETARLILLLPGILEAILGPVFLRARA